MRDPRPRAPAHATHDELLIVRLAGGDALEPAEQATASALVASCPDCARLASDIVALSRAIATEPVPPRRRDFRLSPEKAAELRGSPLWRLFRRFTLPSGGGALKPLASGALSIGLVLVFVGSVVPRQQVDPVPAPMATQVETDVLAATDDVAASTPVVEAGTEESDTMGGEPPSTDEEPDEQPGVDTIGEASGTRTLEMSAAAEAQATSGPASVPELAADASAPEGAGQPLERAMAEPSPGLFAAREPDREAAPDERVDAAADAQTDPVLDDGAAVVVVDEDGLDVGRVLVVTGVALVAVGVVLGLMLLLSRRRPDAFRP